MHRSSVVVSWIILLSCSSLISASTSTTGKTWVVCVAGYDNYTYTYGFEAGVYKLCRELAGNEEENLIIISPDTAAYDVKNPVPGKLVYGKRMFDMVDESVENVYVNIDVTYNSRDMTTSLFYNILSGNEAAVKGIEGGKVLKSGPEDTIILVFISFGTYGIMTLTDNEFLFGEKLIPFLEDLKEQNKFKQMIMIVDGENAGSMFDGYLCTDCNIIAMTSTATQDDFDLCHFNREIRAYTSTCYTFFLIRQLETLRSMDIESRKKYSLFELYQDVRTQMTMFEWVSNLYGDLNVGNKKLSELFPHSTYFE